MKFEDLEKLSKKLYYKNLILSCCSIVLILIFGFILIKGVIEDVSLYIFFGFLLIVGIFLFFVFFFKMIKFHNQIIDIWDEKILVAEKMHRKK